MALLFFIFRLNAQKKISIDLNVGILQSVGSDIIKTYTSNTNPLTIGYFSRKKFNHPYFNFLANIAYPVTPKFKFGLQTGIYTHFLENYFGTVRNTVSIPLMATFKYKLWDIYRDQVGINLSGGLTFFDIDEFVEKIKNGTLLNVSVFYIINKKAIIKLGIEKEIDYASSYYIAQNQFSHDETFKYHLNRNAVTLSYGITLKK